MLLHGPFEVLDFSEILRLLATKSETGRLEVAAVGTAAKLYLARGRLTWAEVEERHPTMPSDTGAENPVVEACARFVYCERGTFEFEPGVTTPAASKIEAEVERTLALAKARADEWRQIAIVVPSLDAHPSLAPEVPTEPVILSRDLWRLVAAIDGRRSVGALARVTGMSTFAVCRLLKQLVEGGVVKVADQPKATLVARPVDEAVDSVEEGLVKVFGDQPGKPPGGKEVDKPAGNESGIGDSLEGGPLKPASETGGDDEGGRQEEGRSRKTPARKG